MLTRSRSHAAAASAQSRVERTGVEEGVAEFEPVGDAVGDGVSVGDAVTDGVSDGVGDDDTGDALADGVEVSEGSGGSASTTNVRGASRDVALGVCRGDCDHRTVLARKRHARMTVRMGAHVIWTRIGPPLSFMEEGAC